LANWYAHRALDILLCLCILTRAVSGLVPVISLYADDRMRLATIFGRQGDVAKLSHYCRILNPESVSHPLALHRDGDLTGEWVASTAGLDEFQSWLSTELNVVSLGVARAEGVMNPLHLPRFDPCTEFVDIRIDNFVSSPSEVPLRVLVGAVLP